MLQTKALTRIYHSKIMAKPKRRQRVVRRVEPILKGAEAKNFLIDYKNYAQLGQFVSDRGKIYGRRRTGFTAKQQRKLSIAIKRVRFLGLLPYKQSFS